LLISRPQETVERSTLIVAPSTLQDYKILVMTLIRIE
jgi:hypothetical protein